MVQQLLLKLCSDFVAQKFHQNNKIPTQNDTLPKDKIASSDDRHSEASLTWLTWQ